MRYLQESIKYPEEAKELGIQGRVFVTFVVEVDGSITDVRVLRGIGGGCDEEAVRVVKAMPKWVPGKQRGVPVRVQFNLPIKFTLQ
jgi:protein TonB